jgi:urease accessory protein
VHGVASPTRAHTATAVVPGRGALRVVRHGARSVVSRAFAASPLKLLTPRNCGRAAWIYSSTYGGGLVDGDALHIELDVTEGAAALVSTQSATKVYRSANGTATHLHATVASDAILVLLPDPVVCFTGSAYSQTQRIDLAASASLVLLDWMTSGRRESGERWAFQHYASRLLVARAGSPIVHDALSLRPADGALAARMGRFDVLAVAVLAGPAVREGADAAIANVAGAAFTRRADLIASASPIPGGAILRLAGRSIEAVGRAIRAQLAFVPALVGDDPWSRKW